MVFLNLGKHQEIIALARKLQDDMETILSGKASPARTLLEDVRQYLLQQRKHMSFEEFHLFPLAESCLSDPDWNLIDAELIPEPDPLFECKLERFQSLYDQIVETEQQPD